MTLRADLEDEGRSLNWLMGWPSKAPPYETPLVERANKALDTPLKHLSVEQIRLLIGQDLGLEFVVPKALALLSEKPLVSGDFYDGDLLCTCLRVPAEFWIEHPGLHYQLHGILGRIDAVVDMIATEREGFDAALIVASSNTGRRV